MFTVTSMVAITPSLRSQDGQDPYAVDPVKRYSASLPVPYGLILTGSYPAFVKLSDNHKPLISYGGSLYYDTWQVGAHRREYGDVISIMTRTSGRDVFLGWFVEFGRVSYDSVVSNDTLVVIGSASQNVFGFGVEGNYGFGDTTSPTMGYRISVGPDYLFGELALGLRLPIDKNGVRLFVKGIAGIMPSTRRPRHDYRGEHMFLSNEESGVLGVSITASFGLNFQWE